jgi:uncharacterized membrane protein
MKGRISPVMLFIGVALSLSALSFFLLWSEVSSINQGNTGYIYPVSSLEVLFFLARPLLLLAPFLLTITIIGSYALTRLWLRDVIINVVTETYEKNIKIDRTKYLTSEEKMVLNIIIKNQPDMIQSDLVKESKLSKYKITRILDRFEHLELVRREKYGITNIIHLLIKLDPLEI